VIIMSSDVAQKRIGILHELLPRSAMIAILANPTNDGSLAEAIDAQQGAGALGKQARSSMPAPTASLTQHLRTSRSSQPTRFTSMAIRSLLRAPTRSFHLRRI